MNVKSRIYIIGTCIGLVMFYGLHHLYLKEGTSEVQQPTITDENIEVAIDAYSNAIKDGVPKSDLDELNKSFSTDFGVRVYQRADQKFVVTNLAGREVKVV